MVYFGKKQGTVPANTATTDGNNTFTGTNTFNNPVVIPEPTQDNEAANKKYVDDLNDQIEQEINAMPKLGLDNTFTGNNTFNNAIITNHGLYSTNTDMLIAKQDAQSGKTMHFDFKQPSGVFKNYCFVNYRFTTNDTAYTSLLSMEFRPDTSGTDNNQVILSTDLSKISFNKPIVGIPNPTENTQVANKQYVDNRILEVEKANLTGWTKQEVITGNTNKYYVSKTLADLGLANKKILNIVLKSNPTTGKHIQLTYFNNAGTIIFNIFQFGSTDDITTNLNTATFVISYIN